jgi:hypothetical protein
MVNNSLDNDSNLTFSQDQNASIANFTELAEILIKNRSLEVNSGWGMVPPSQFEVKMIHVQDKRDRLIPFLDDKTIVTIIAVSITIGTVAGIALVLYVLYILVKRYRIRRLRLALERKQARLEKKLNENAIMSNEQEKLVRSRVSLLQKVLGIHRGGSVINVEVKSFKELEKETLSMYCVLSGNVTKFEDIRYYMVAKENFEKELEWKANLESVFKAYMVEVKATTLKRKTRFQKLKQKFKIKTPFKRVRNRLIKSKEWLTSDQVLATLVAIGIMLFASQARGQYSRPKQHSPINNSTYSMPSRLINEEDLKLRDSESKEISELKPEFKQDIKDKSRVVRPARVFKKRYKTLADLSPLPEFSETVEEVQSPINNPSQIKIRVKE